MIPQETTTMTFHIKRAGSSNVQYAEIFVHVWPEQLQSEQVFLEALRNALTEWVTETSDGLAAYRANRHDFSIEDLASELDSDTSKDIGEDSPLWTILKKHGIFEIEITLVEKSDFCLHWTYDTMLMGVQACEDALRKKPRKEAELRCKFCQRVVKVTEARKHDGGYVGPCCWDDRLKQTE